MDQLFRGNYFPCNFMQYAIYQTEFHEKIPWKKLYEIPWEEKPPWNSMEFPGIP